MNENNDMSAGEFDDHEPGDVNGNVDPAWAKKQAKASKRAPRAEGSAKPPGAPRAPRQPRAPRTPRVPRQATNNSAETTSIAPVQTNDAAAPLVMHETIAPVLAPATEAAVGAASEAALENSANEGVQTAPRGRPRTGERRTRGLRRTRRNDRSRDDASIGSSQNEANLHGQDVVYEFNQVNDNQASSPNENVDSSENVSSPNPGAFGDPMRPMDRSARRNRNRNRHRESHEERRERQAERASAEAAVSLIDEQTGEPIENAADGERLHKVLAQQGLGSRREMESLIEAGEIEVNGKPAQVGQIVNETDRVFVKRRKVKIKLGDDKPRILIYHKPAGEIVTRDDPEQRDTVFDRLPKPDHGKWIAMGRLDYNTEGLLLFTTYGELANRMMHPRYEILREYSVRILGELTPEQEDELIDGIELDDGPARVLSLDRIDRDSEGANHWYRITINEGRNREVRRMFEHLGLTVSRLIRTRYGVVNMPSWLKRGQFKLLDENDTFNVLESVGLRSRKKLEKAARFGGARGKLPQGPVGPMRSASEHDAIWNGAAAPGTGLPGARDRRTNGRNNRGPRGRGAAGDNIGASLSLQQQQFPGFGGATVDSAAPSRARPQRRVRGPGGDVDGNVAPGYRSNGQGRGRNQGGQQGNQRRRGRRPFDVASEASAGLNDPMQAGGEGMGLEGANAAGQAPNDRNNNRGRRNQRGRNQGGNTGTNTGYNGNRRGRRNFNGQGSAEATSSDAPALDVNNAGTGGEARTFDPNSNGQPRRTPRGRRYNGRGPRRPRPEGQTSSNDFTPPADVE